MREAGLEHFAQHKTKVNDMRKRKDPAAPILAMVKLDPKADRKIVKAIDGVMRITHSKSYSATIKSLIVSGAASFKDSVTS
tara:strand:+ start:104 stop:346 length:243 start_codon:yes stop_codon:yes gene_type:complete